MTPLACPLLIICLNLAALPGHSVQAQEAAAEDSVVSDAAVKFRVEGNRLYYDTMSGDDLEIDNDDVDRMRDLLRANSGITTLLLKSGGGSVWAAREMARIAIDFELDTTVDGECSSSCVRIFLAGARRDMSRGSKIGFHSRHWSPDSAESYYDKWREDEDWEDPFDFVSWVYRDTYAEAYEDITWSIERGVAAEFAVEMHAPRERMWFPSRIELRDAGILRD